MRVVSLSILFGNLYHLFNVLQTSTAALVHLKVSLSFVSVSPLSRLTPAQRQALADDLNGAILSFQGQPQCSPVEQAWQQLRAVMTELRHHDHPLAVMVDEEAVVLTPPAPPAAASGGAPSGGQQGGAAGGSSSSLMGSLFGSLLLPKQAGGSGGGGGPAGSGVPGSSATAPHSHHVL